MKKRDFIYTAVIALLLLALATSRPATEARIETRTDTVIVRDTVRDTAPVVKSIRTVRTDTVWLRLAADTVFVEVEAPVERRVYETEDYRAVVEGFRPSLTGIEIYRKTAYVNTETVIRRTSRRWGIGIQAGYGYGGGGLHPYVGAGIQYHIITW